MGRRMIDTESGKPKARARAIRRWVAVVLLVIVIAIAYAVERGWVHAPGVALGPAVVRQEPPQVRQRLYWDNGISQDSLRR